MPVGGEIYEINDQLNDLPEILNESPYENGWIIKIKPNSSDEFSSLLTSVQYKKEIGVL